MDKESFIVEYSDDSTTDSDGLISDQVSDQWSVTNCKYRVIVQSPPALPFPLPLLSPNT